MDAKDIRALLASQRDQKFRKRSDAQLNADGLRSAKFKDPVYRKSFLEQIAASGHVKTYQGKSMVLWAEELGVDTGTIYYNLDNHGHLENVVPMSKKLTDYQGKTHAEWAREKGVDRTTIVDHLKKHGHLDNVKKRDEKIWNGKSYMEWAHIFGFKPANSEPVYKHMKKHGHLENLRQYQDWAKQNNVSLVHAPYKKPTKPEKIVYEGKTYKQLTAEYGVKSQTILHHLKLHGNLDNLEKKKQ